MITVTNLSKSYDGLQAVKDISFHIEKGKIYGFLGPNGAGKTTTMNMMTGCLPPTSGSITVCGYDIFEQEQQAKRCIGYLPEQPPLYTEMTPKEFLTFVAQAKGLKGAQCRNAVERALRETQIDEVQDRLIANLSKGYRQRVGIAQAMLGEPQIIILDEPTVGLDPAQVMEIRDLIRRLGRKKTVILSSHILSEINAVCNHVIILSEGRIVADDSIATLKQFLSAEHSLSLRIKGSRERAERLLHTFEQLRNITFLGAVNNVWECKVGADGFDDALLEKIFLAFAKENMPILGMQAAQTSLEDVFLRLTDGSAVAPSNQTEKEG